MLWRWLGVVKGRLYISIYIVGVIPSPQGPLTHEATERNTNEGGPSNDDENKWDKGHDSSDGDEFGGVGFGVWWNKYL